MIRAPITRRALARAASAALGAAALPAAAIAASPAAPGPDAELFGLLARLKTASAMHDAVSQAVDGAAAGSAAYRAACRRCDQATGLMLDLEDRIHRTPARTLAGLVAKARIGVEAAERAELDGFMVEFLREVAAFQVPT